MDLINWRREGLFLTIAGMETCWIVAWSRVLFDRPGSAVTGLSWWSVWALFMVALITARTLGRVQLRRAPWLIGALAFFTALSLLWGHRGSVSHVLQRPSGSSAGVEVLILMLGLFVWFRALRVPEGFGDTQAIARRFQIGLLVLIGSVLISRWFQAPMTDIVIAYFGFGLLAIALTRIEEVARVEPSGAAPLNRKWVIMLSLALLVAGTITLLATRVITVETVRWMLRPLTALLTVAFFIFALLATELLSQLLPLLRWLLGDIDVEQLRKGLQDLREPLSPQQEDVRGTRILSPQLQEALVTGLVVALILVALLVLVRSFRGWRTRQYDLPGGVRETVDPEGTLAEDLAAFLRDQWQRLRGADLRRLFRRLGTASAQAIYASMLALLAAEGHPRQPEQTPYEYAPVAAEALPTCRAEIKAITHAYVRARYGEAEISAEELAYLQDAWKRIQAEGVQLQ